MTNAEVYGAIALILMELQKINAVLDKLLESTVEDVQINYGSQND